MERQVTGSTEYLHPTGSGKRTGGDTDTAPGADPTLLHALRQIASPGPLGRSNRGSQEEPDAGEFEQFYNGHRPHPGIANARPLCPLPTRIADPDGMAHLTIRRRDRLGGILHEYEHAA
jgi:hypothetical protein